MSTDLIARLIEAGDMDSIERRLLVTAYEDIGLGNPAADFRAAGSIPFPGLYVPAVLYAGR